MNCLIISFLAVRFDVWNICWLIYFSSVIFCYCCNSSWRLPFVVFCLIWNHSRKKLHNCRV